MVVAVLVVAGGGGGGGGQSGLVYPAGGGGGEVLYNPSFSISSGDKTVTVGNGGTTNPDPTPGQDGEDSVFDSLTARGGQGGGYVTRGQGGTSGNTTYSGGIRVGGDGSGGGGGNGAAGTNGNVNTPGNGGNGSISTIYNGTNIYYGGGGGGKGSAGDGSGGLGGGGSASTPGTANTGGGGSGISAGGSGIVIIRYLTADFGTCTGGTKTTDGNYTVHKFTSSGTMTFVEKGGGAWFAFL